MTNLNNAEICTTIGYDDLGRFKSYYYQVKFISELNKKKILEVGIGNKTLYNYLKQHGLDAYTCDSDKALKPDYVADIKSLPMNDNEYDIVCAFEILEHLPWQDFEQALNELARVSKRDVIISIPYNPVSIDIVIKSSIFYRLFKIWELKLFLNLALITRKWKYDGVHYWEMGKRNYPRKKIRTLLRQKFNIIKEKRTDLSYQYFFVLEKKDNRRN